MSSQVVKSPTWSIDEHWTNDVQFPYTNPTDAIQYITAKWPEKLKTSVVIPGTIPQSYVYWWCHCRDDFRKRRTYPPIASYTRLERWRPAARKWLNTDSVDDTDIIVMFKTWLDLLFIDLTVFNDELHREGVPCLHTNGIVSDIKIPGIKHVTRRNTVKFIAQQGSAIFKERGFTEGLKWWLQECKIILAL